MKIDMNSVATILDDVTFYEDAHNRKIVYAEFRNFNNETWLCNVDGDDFKAFLRISYSLVANTDEELPVDPILRRIHDESRIYCKNAKVDIHYRLAGDLHGRIEYFLADAAQNSVQVDANGVRLVNVSNHKFLRRAGTLSQVTPKQSINSIFDLLHPFVNISGDEFKLFVIWLIQAFSSGSHYCVFLSAERGSGKSLLTHVINKLIDPSPAETSTMPRNLDDLETFLANHYLCCFDNIDKISKEFSDIFCVAVTGGTVPRRKKFYDTDMVYLQLHNVIVFNGIGIAPAEEDLAERALFFEMKKLQPTEIIPERELWQSFDTKRPEILWCIFEILSKASKIIGTLNPKKKARMADAYIEMLAIAKVLGLSEDEINGLLDANAKAMGEANLPDSVAMAVDEYMKQHKGRKLHGSSTEVYEKIAAVYSGRKGLLPVSAAAFGRRLKEVTVPLKRAGYRVLIDDTGARYNTITIIREK